ncbi:MAG TPA: hypothetical protein VIJ51_01090 [Solirubrobacteraceae bacterium]
MRVHLWPRERTLQTRRVAQLVGGLACGRADDQSAKLYCVDKLEIDRLALAGLLVR